MMLDGNVFLPRRHEVTKVRKELKRAGTAVVSGLSFTPGMARVSCKGRSERKELRMGFGETTSVEVERVASAIVDSAMKVHRKLGPGLLESVYSACLAHELRSRGFRVDREVPIAILYEGITLDEGYKIDLLVDDLVVIEVKAVQEIHPVFAAQCRTYVRLANKRLGFLINFNVPLLKDGLKRIVN